MAGAFWFENGKNRPGNIWVLRLGLAGCVVQKMGEWPGVESVSDRGMSRECFCVSV